MMGSHPVAKAYLEDGACIHCRQPHFHDTSCIVAVRMDRDSRDRKRAPREFNTVHEHVVRKVPNLEHPEVIARAVSHTMARRIANALEHYTPGPKGY